MVVPAGDRDLPVYQACAPTSPHPVTTLQTENLKASPIRSWIGLYALLKMIRDAKMTSFTRQGITAMLKTAKDVPMLGMFGGENWTPNTEPRRPLQAGGHNHWAV